MVQLVYLRVKS